MIWWLTSDANAPVVAARGFVITVLGFFATAVGLWFTYRQARDAALAAERASDAVDRFKTRLNLQEASRDISTVVNALEETKRHLNGGTLKHATESYEAARASLIKLQVNQIVPLEHEKFLKDLNDHIVEFCDAAEIHEAGKGDPPDRHSIIKFIRDCRLDFAKLDAHLMRDL